MYFLSVCVCVSKEYNWSYPTWKDNVLSRSHRLSNKKPSARHKISPFKFLLGVSQKPLSFNLGYHHFSWFPERTCQTLLLKTLHCLITQHEEIDLVLTWKNFPY